MFAIHGIPQEIVTDNGPQFRNEFRNFTQQLDIKHITTSPYHPRWVMGKVMEKLRMQ